MGDYEYTVIPAPARGEKTRAAKTPADRFAHALTNALNGMAAQGWEYVRAETLPSEERSGLTGRATVWMNVLVFRRALAPAQAEAAAIRPAPQMADAPAAAPAGPAASLPVPRQPEAPEDRSPEPAPTAQPSP